MVLLTSTRSKRELETFFPISEGVGPGTYDCHRWGDEEVTTNGAAVELQKRPIGTRFITKASNPGPGTYNVRRAASESAVDHPRKTNPSGTGAISLRSQAHRISKDDFKEPLLVPGSSGYLVSSIAENPGPGQYNPALNHVGQPSGGITAEPGREHPKSMVLFQTVPSFPPLRSQEDFRYSGRGDDTLSPGDYPQDSHSAMKTVLGHSAAAVNFHNCTSSQRELIPKKCSIENRSGFAFNPTAPGSYELAGKLLKGTSQPFSSKDPQLGTSQPFKSKSCSTSLTPGPGLYPLDDGHEVLDQHFKPSEAGGGGGNKAQPGYRSAITRNGIFRPALSAPYIDSDSALVPGPGHYPQPASAFLSGKAKRARSSPDVLRKKFLAVHTPSQQASLQATDALALCGFASTGSRDCLVPDQHQPVAEPGTYDPSDSMGQSIGADLREPARIAKAGVFGSTKGGDRFRGFALDGRPGLPAPGDHDLAALDKTSWNGGADAAGGAFRSQSSRIARVELGLKPHVRCDSNGNAFDALSPAAATSASSPSSPAVKFRRGRQDHLCFGSCQNRFGGVKEMVDDAPGPGDYDVNRTLRFGKWVRGAAKSTTNRQMEPEQPRERETGPGTSPGPGKYEMVDTMADVSRRTFNRSSERAGGELRQAAKTAQRPAHASDASPKGLSSASQTGGALGLGGPPVGARSQPALAGGPRA